MGSVGNAFVAAAPTKFSMGPQLLYFFGKPFLSKTSQEKTRPELWFLLWLTLDFFAVNTVHYTWWNSTLSGPDPTWLIIIQFQPIFPFYSVPSRHWGNSPQANLSATDGTYSWSCDPRDVGHKISKKPSVLSEHLLARGAVFFLSYLPQYERPKVTDP